MSRPLGMSGNVSATNGFPLPLCYFESPTEFTCKYLERTSSNSIHLPFGNRVPTNENEGK